MRRVDLETGNVNTNKRVVFHLVKNENIFMGDAVEASFPLDQWKTFLDQLRDAFQPGSPQKSGWRRLFDGLFDLHYRPRNLKNYPLSPLGSEEMRAVSRNSVTSTAAYQLFLASIDITNKFLFEEDDEKYTARCLVSTGTVYSRHGHRGIFLIDNKWLGSDDDTKEFVDKNRLCKAIFDEKIVRYYIPYTVPFEPELSVAASKTWDSVRDRYYLQKWAAQ